MTIVQLNLYKAEYECYNVHTRTGSVNKDERGTIMGEKRELVYALGFCIVNRSTSVVMLQRMTNWGYARANAAIDWMEKNNYIAKIAGMASRKVIISLNQYKLSFRDYLNRDRLFIKKYEKQLLALLEN